MQNRQTSNQIYLGQTADFRGLLPIIVLWGAAVLLGIIFYWFQAGEDAFGEYYLVPWSLLAGLVIFSPTAYFISKGQFDLFNPLIYAALSYIIPAFVGGGLILAFGWSKPYYLTFVEDPKYELPLSLIYVTLGYVGVTIGYFLPVSRYFAEKLDGVLPNLNWQPSQVWVGGILLIVAGFGVNILALVRGLAGYQVTDTVEQFDGLIRFLLVMLSEGTMLLWLAIFMTKRKSPIFYGVLILLLMIIPLRMAVLGSRGSLLLAIIPIAMAFNYSGRRLKWQHGTIFALLVAGGIFIGIIYGTTFRNVKGSEARMEVGDYFGQVVATADYLSNHDIGIMVEEGFMALAERVENLSSVGVVVSNYEKLAPYEAAYGLENNIINDTVYSFIPRFIWADKPGTSDSRAYSDLYFNFGENSFAVTPFGDLLRNFGVIGIPLGMMLVGFYLRLIYTSLIATHSPAMWKKVVYYPLLTVVSYESFYATIFPSVLRVLFVAAISILLINQLIKRMPATEK